MPRSPFIGALALACASSVFIGVEPNRSSASAFQEQRPWHAKKIASLTGHTVPVQVAAISPDGRLLASATRGKNGSELKLWDIAAEKELAAPPWPKGYVSSFAFSGDSQRLLAVGDSPPSFLIWDIAKKEIVGSHADTRNSGGSYALAMNHTGGRFASASYETIGVFEAKYGNSAMIARPTHRSYSSGTFTPDLKWYAFGNSQDIDLWDLTTGKEAKILGEHRGVVKSIAFSQDGKTLIAVSIRSTRNFKSTAQLKFWDIATGKTRWDMELETYQVWGLKCSADEKTLALLDYPEVDGKTEVVLVDVAAKKEAFRLREPNMRFQSPTFVDNDRILAAGFDGDKNLQVWQVSR